MKQAIDEFKAMPGVVGCCIYSSMKGVHLSNLPAVFKPERLATIGEQLFRLHSAGNKSLRDLYNISIYYDEAVIVTRLLKVNQLLFIICDPSLNQNLLVMSLNLLQDKFEDSQDGPEPGATAQSLRAEKTVQSAEFQTDERLSALCSELRSLLGKILGPMAGYVFDETFSDWQKQRNAEIDHIGTLIDMLNREIADTDKIEYFQKLIAPKLSSFRNG